MSQPADGELDLVLVGATGFVGRLTAHHLTTYAPPDPADRRRRRA